MQRNLVNAYRFSRLIKNRCFDQNGYSLGERINLNSEIMALIGQYSASLRIMRALVRSLTLVTSVTLVPSVTLVL